MNEVKNAKLICKALKNSQLLNFKDKIFVFSPKDEPMVFINGKLRGVDLKGVKKNE